MRAVFSGAAVPPPSSSSSKANTSHQGWRRLLLKDVPWRTPATGEGREAVTELDVQFVPHEQFDSAPLPVNKFQWPYAYVYAAICKVCSDCRCRAWHCSIRTTIAA